MKSLHIVFRQALPAGPARSGIRLLALLPALVGAVILASISFGTATASGPEKSSPVRVAASLSKTPTLRFEGAGNRRVNLSGGSDLITSYEGSQEAAGTLERNEATPLATASDDFDEDGVPDLVCSYQSPIGGILTLHRGNVDAIYPNAPGAKERRARGRFTDAPFLSPARAFELAERPDLIGAGDFNADDHHDIVTAQIGGNTLWFYPGDGRGGFGEARQIVLAGAVTAMTVGEVNRRDGLPDIVVGISGTAGAKALVFESPLGAINARPEEFNLPAPASSLALGEIVGDYEQDLAIAVGHQLIVVSGRDRKLSFDASNQQPVERPEVSSRSFNFNIKSLVIGNFRGGDHTDIAMLGDDGRVRINRNPTPVASKRRRTTLAGWRTEPLETEVWPLATKIVRARVSSNPSDTILVLDPAGHRVSIIDRRPEANEKSSPATLGASAGGVVTSSLVADSEPMAVLPMRLSISALSSLVVLNQSRSSPSVVFPAAPMTFTVNNAGDTSDAAPGNGVCNDGSGNCTLRAAIQEANANAGADTINFSVGTGAVSITPGFVLPQITETLTLDGTTQPGFAGTPLVEIPGSGVSPGEDGISIMANNCLVRGLVINRFSGLLSGIGVSLQGSNNIVEGNFIGTNASGTGASGNDFGVLASTGTGNRVGGTVAGARNIISGNGSLGVRFSNSNNNTVQGNFIGTDITGTIAVPNFDGVSIFNPSGNNLIGGTAAGARNVISGNNGFGGEITIFFGTGNNLIQGNFIGTNLAGTAAIPSNSNGITIDGSPNNTIGGTTAAAGNLISGNFIGVVITTMATGNIVQGNFVGTDITGNSALGNANSGIMIDNTSNTTVGGTVAGAGNLISGNNAEPFTVGIEIQNSPGNQIQGNLIGTNVTGTAALPNTTGISVTSPNNQIGGTAAGARNVISGNLNSGVTIAGASATGNVIQGNFIGTDITGALDVGNNTGVQLSSSTNTTVGGTAAGARNLISGNDFNVQIGFSANNNLVQGNLIGTNSSGTAALSSSTFDGILIFSSTGNVIGGTSAAARNIISGNFGNGISLGNMADNNTVQGNFIGTDITGAVAVPNSNGISFNGSNNLIGGTVVGAGNVISGNNGVGISLFTNSSNNTVQGNFIGTQANGTTALPNTFDGVNIDGPSSNNTIGGTVAGARNVIAFNGGRGINVLSGAGNAFFTNSIFSNANLGIDLNFDGVTPNDAGDADAGPNNLQNFPVLTSVTPGATTTIQGTLNSTTSTTFRIEFFSNTACDGSGNGEGATFLGFTNVTTDGSGNATFNVILPVSLPAGNVVVATATDPANNTSEFSACVTVAVSSGCTISCPPNQTASNAFNQCGAAVNYPPPTTSGPCSGAITCTPPSGSFFPIGTTNVNCKVGSAPSCSFTVTVNDTRAPSITCPPNQNVGASGPTAVNYPPPTVADNCPGVTSNCSPPSGSTFPVGATAVNCTATDASGNTANCSFTVTVTSGCTITCPPNQTASAGATQCGATVNYPAPTTAGPCGAVSCSPASGTSFGLGVTTVTCTTGLGPTCSFTVAVVDNRPPTIACPPNISKVTDPGKLTAVISYALPAVVDNCPGATVLCSPPSGFAAPVGITTVTCTGRDSSDNTSSCSFTATVDDPEPPVIRCPGSVMIDVGPGQTSGVVNYPPPTVSDNLPGATASCAPPSGSTFPLGVTTVNCTATDVSGNRSSCGFTVTVNGGTPAVRVTLPGGRQRIEYGGDEPVPPSRKPPKRRNNPCGFFTVENMGRAPVVLTYASVVRRSPAVDSGKITDPNERGFYQLSLINQDGTETEVPTGTNLTIGIGRSLNFCLRFIALIPAVTTSAANLPASAVLSEEVNSRVNFTVQGGSPASVDVVANVATKLMLINPDNPRKAPRVTFARLGNEFVLTYSAHDSNLDVSRAKYEFLDGGGNVVGQAIEIDLSQPISDRGLLKGQSFTVEQRFTGAASRPEITACRVTVFDGETSVTKTSTSAQSAAASLARGARRATLTPPTIRIDPRIGEPK